uniref:Serine/threonine-protein kinase dst1-like n=1 Tax=Dermatophagoides pteronyssinus TaxID=6956 RepID=A0A6P6YCK7_DERPT
MITRSISRQSIQLEMVDSKESLNLSKSVSFIDLIDSIENDNQPTTIVEKQIDQQQLVDDDDDDIEKQSKEQVEDLEQENNQNDSKTETNLEQEISIDNKSGTMINEKPTVINQRSKQPKTNDDTQQPKEIIKDNKKREKSQSKDTEEFNIITRSTSKKIAKQTKSPPPLPPPPVVDVIPTRSNHRSKSMSLETKITSSPTVSSSSTSTTTTTTSISDTKEIDIIMARKLRNIVKSIGKHDYFDYIKRSQSSSLSSLNDVIEKPINIENIMIEI